MKNLRYTVGALMLLAGTANAQIDRSKAPQPGPAPEIQMGSYESMTLDNGLKVFVIENHKLPKVSYSLVVDYDPIMEGEKAGYVEMMGTLLRQGTDKRTKAQIDEEIDMIGASFNTSRTGFYASSLKKHNQKLLDIVSDVLLRPSFPKDELEAERSRMLDGLKQSRNSADAMAASSGAALRYGLDHPYGEQMTEETLEKFTREDVKKHYDTYFRPNISYLVIVGDITMAEAGPMVKKYFGEWKKAEVPTHVYKTPKEPKESYVAFVNKPGAVQSLINVTYPIDLKPGSDDAIAASVMNSILGGGVFQGRLMQNLREDKAYTYGARSALRTDKLVGNFVAFASVRNEVTDSSITQFLYELERIVKENVSEESLQMTKNQMAGSFARSLESPQTIARFALNTERYNLPKNYYANYLKKLDKVTVADIRRVAEKYIRPKNAIIHVVGSKDDVADKLEQFGEVKYFDMYGNPVKEEMRAAPEGMTARDVINKHLEARYGTSDAAAIEKKLKARKDVVQTMNMSMQGMTIDIVSKRKYPNMESVKVSMGGNVVQKEWFDGKSGGSSGMQGESKLEGEKLEDKKRDARMGLETRYEELGYKMELIGIEKVNKMDAYKVVMTDPKGNKTTDWYSVDTGLKIRSMTTADMGMGPMTTIATYSDYKEVDGIKYAHKIVREAGPQTMEMKVTKVETNTGLKKKDFRN